MDLDLLFLQPGRLQPFAGELARRFSNYNPAAVCGPLVGEALLAQMVAIELGVEFYYTERFAPAQRDTLYSVEYRLPASLRPIVSGKAVVIVDDVINAGSATRATLAALRLAGVKVAAVGHCWCWGQPPRTFWPRRISPLRLSPALKAACGRRLSVPCAPLTSRWKSYRALCPFIDSLLSIFASYLNLSL